MLAVERLFSTAVGGGGGVHPSGTFRTQDVFSASVRGFFASSSSSQHSALLHIAKTGYYRQLAHCPSATAECVYHASSSAA